jgi:hypothetical protein
MSAVCGLSIGIISDNDFPICRRSDQEARRIRQHHQENVGSVALIEVKAAKKVGSRDFKGLLALEEENGFKQFFLVLQDLVETKSDKIHCLHLKTFVERLWFDKLF